MNTYIRFALQTAVIMYTMIHFVTIFWKEDILITLLSLAGLSIFILSIFYHSLLNFKLPIIIFLTAVLILFYSKNLNLTEVLDGIVQMRNVIGLLIIIPLTRWVLIEESYIESIMGLFYKLINTSQRFYLSLLTFTQIFSYFLLFGSISVMYQIVNKVTPEDKPEIWDDYIGTALLRGFSFSSLWVISIPSFAFIVETLKPPLWVAILQGLFIAILGMLLAGFIFRLQEKQTADDLTAFIQKNLKELLENIPEKEHSKKLVIEFTVLFLSLFGTVFLISGFMELPLLVIIPIIVILWLLSFYLIKRRLYKLPIIVKSYVQSDLLNQTYQVNIMLTVGVLILSLQQTNFSEIVVNGLNSMNTFIPGVNPLFLLPFVVVLLGFMGMGPLTVMVLVAGIVASLNLPYPPELIVLAITSGSVIAKQISPIIMSVIVLSASNRLSVLKNGIINNWQYSIYFYLLTQLYIQIRLI